MAKNKRQLKKEISKTINEMSSNNSIAALMFNAIESGTSGSASLNNQIQNDSSQNNKSKRSVENLSSIASDLKNISKNFASLETIFQKALKEKQYSQYRKEESEMETVPEKPALSATARPEDNEKGFFELVKDFFTNPAVIAAFSGLVYLILPKDIKEKINSFFGGFIKGLSDTSEPLSNLQIALIGAGTGLATYLGASALKSIADAISTTLSLITRAKTSFGKLKGKGIKGVLKAATQNKAAVAGVAVGGATAGALMLSETTSDKGVSPQTEQTTSQTEVETRPPVSSSAPAPSSSTQDEQPMDVDLEQYVVKKDSSVDLAGLDPNLKKRLAGMAKEYYDKTGKKIQINSAYRDPKEQAELFKKVGAPKAAPPGKSKHEFGIAFDMNSGDAAAAIQLGLFQKYGFTRPIPAETWHVEPVENRGGSFPDNPVRPGAPIIVASAKGAVIPGTGEKVPQSLIKPSITSSAQSEKSQLKSLVTESPKLEPLEQPANSGEEISNITEDVESEPFTSDSSVTNNSYDFSRQLAEKRGAEAPLPIPSPVADRGSLNRSTKHTTAYA